MCETEVRREEREVRSKNGQRAKLFPSSNHNAGPGFTPIGTLASHLPGPVNQSGHVPGAGGGARVSHQRSSVAGDFDYSLSKAADMTSRCTAFPLYLCQSKLGPFPSCVALTSNTMNWPSTLPDIACGRLIPAALQPCGPKHAEAGWPSAVRMLSAVSPIRTAKGHTTF